MAVHGRPRAAGPRGSRRPGARTRPCTRFRGTRLAEPLRFARRSGRCGAEGDRLARSLGKDTRGEPSEEGEPHDEGPWSSRCADRASRLGRRRARLGRRGLNAYRANAKGLKQLRELKKLGFDLTEGKRRKGVEIVATKAQIRKLRRAGIKAKLIRTRRGRTALKVERRAGGRRLSGVASRTRAPTSPCRAPRATPRRTQDSDRADRASEEPGHREARDDRPLAARAADLRDQGHEERQEDGRTAAGRRSSTRPSSTRASGSRARPSGARCALFVDNYGKTGTAKGTDGQPIDGRLLEGADQAREQARAVVHPDRQPRRLRLHVRPGEPAVAQEPARQQRRRPDHRRRRRGPEPELPDALELRRRGLEHRHVVRDLPRHGPGLRAGDAGVPVADEPGPLRLQQERPHGGTADPVAVRLAGGHASPPTSR